MESGVQDLNERLAGLSPAKRELLLRQLRRTPGQTAGTDKIPRRPESYRSRAPLSFAQQRLWFLEQLEPGLPVYHIPLVRVLTNTLDVVAFEESVNDIVRRHEALRTTFVLQDGEPLQMIAPSLRLQVPVIDVQGLPEAEQQERARRAILESFLDPFDLEQGPLLRVSLVRLAPDGHVFLLCVHHLICDGASLDILVAELMVNYQARAEGITIDLPPLEVQYADYALWQREQLQGELLEKQLTYWDGRLAGAPALLELPTDHPRPASLTYGGATYRFPIPSSLLEQLRELSRRNGVTLYMTLLAAYQLLLHRYSGQDDIVVGTPIANRDQRELEWVIGLFVNTLVLRTDLSGNPTMRELLQRVREVALGAYAHQNLPFEILVDRLHPERSLNHSPIVQVVFNLLERHPVPTQQAPPPEAPSSGLEMKRFESDTATAKFDLTLSVVEADDEYLVQLEYSTDLFEAETIGRMARHYQQILEGMVAHPEARIGELEMLTAPEKQELTQRSQAQTSYPVTTTLPQLFAAQVTRTPQARAVTCQEAHLTYQELDVRANQLAHQLQALGVGPGTLVGLLLDRSLDLVVGILGILKAGGAYLPLDPSSPPERMAFMLADAQAPVLLTQAAFRDHLPALAGTILVLDEAADLLAQQPSTPPLCAVHPSDLAYVIYTSGSTGLPKGVMVTHANVVRLFQATDPWFHFAAHDVWTLFHSVAFDFSVWEIFGALLSGGRLVVVPYLTSRSPEAVSQLLRDEQVTILNQTPSAFLQLMQAEESREDAAPLALRLVIFGGEALQVASLRPWFARHGDQSPQLVNMYGITETTVHVTYRPLREEDLESGPASPIGGPIPDLELWVLDAQQQLVPPGVPGELYVGGGGVTLGYLQRPALTAQRFVPHPFGPPGRRLYRTGDLVRQRSDGELEYLGRIDQQVKVRGFRIELGEIETRLAEHPGVREAAVLLRQDDPDTKRLVAYLVPVGEMPPVEDLRGFLQQTLPEYMLPAAFVPIDSFPLTSNGKLDRKALPAPDVTRDAWQQEYVAPRTPQEETLAGIWAEVLNLEQVGIHDNFFALGGDSILSIQIIARARQAQLSLTPRDLFQHPTIAELASLNRREQRVEAEQGAVTGPAPLTPIQRWFFEQDLADAHHWNQAMIQTSQEPLDPPLVKATIQCVLAHHDVLRARFTRGPTGWEQVIAGVDGDVPFAHVDLSHLPRGEQSGAIDVHAAEFQASLNLSEGPLVRVALFDRGDAAPNAILIVAHHLVIDGVSWRILIEDLQTVYNQLLAGQQPRLPAKTTSYRRWAERLVDYARSDDVTAERGYWLSPARYSAPGLPIDYLRGPNTVESSRTAAAVLTREQTEALLRKLPAVYGTQINEILLTALVEALGSWTGARTLLVDMEGHGREDIFDDVDLTRTVGWFTTIFPLCLQGGATPLATLRQVGRELAALPKRGIGYGLLRYLSPDEAIGEELQRLPQPGIAFNYLGQFGHGEATPEGETTAANHVSSGPARSGRANRAHLIDVDAVVQAGQLAVVWTYSENLHRPETIQSLSQAFMDVLLGLIEQREPLTAQAANLPSDRDVDEATPSTPVTNGDGRSTRPEQEDLVSVAGDSEEDRDPRTLLTVVRGAGSKQPLIYHHGDAQGGGFYAYRLAEHIDRDRPIYVLHPHGLDKRFPPSIEEMAASCIEVLRTVQPHGPYLFAGFCAGGVVVLEMARQLRQQGEQVDLLVLIDIGATEDRVLIRLRKAIELVGPRLGLGFDQQFATYVFLRRMLRNYYHMMRLQGEARLRFAATWARKGVERLILAPLLALVLRQRMAASEPPPITPEVALSRINDGPVMARFSWAHSHYKVRPYAGRIVLLYAQDEIAPDPLLAGWQAVPQDVELIAIPGDHVTCRTDHVASLAAELTRHLERSEEAVG